MAERIRTSIELKRGTKGRLELLKIHPRQSFDELINEILDFLEYLKSRRDEYPSSTPLKDRKR